MASEKRNEINSKKLQITVDCVTENILSEMVQFGIHGSNKASVAAWIIKTWIWENHKELRGNGIELKSTQND